MDDGDLLDGAKRIERRAQLVRRRLHRHLRRRERWTSGRPAPTSGTCTRARTHHTPSVSEKREGEAEHEGTARTWPTKSLKVVVSPAFVDGSDSVAGAPPSKAAILVFAAQRAGATVRSVGAARVSRAECQALRRHEVEGRGARGARKTVSGASAPTGLQAHRREAEDLLALCPASGGCKFLPTAALTNKVLLCSHTVSLELLCDIIVWGE